MPRIRPLAGVPTHVDLGRYRFLSGLSAPNLVGTTATTSVSDWIASSEEPWYTQAEELHVGLAELLDDVGGHANMLRQHVYQKTKRKFPVFEEARRRHEKSPTPSSGVGVDVLQHPAAQWEVDGIALSPAGRREWGDRQVLSPGAVGAGASYYSQAVRVGNQVFLAGMIPVNTDDHTHIRDYSDIPPEGQLLRTGRSHPDSRRGPIIAQTWYVYQNIFNTLRANGLGLDALSNITIFVSNSEDAADALRVHEHLLGDSVATVQLIQLDEIGHRGMLVEVEATALAGAVRPQYIPTQTNVMVTVADDLVFFSDALGLTSTDVSARAQLDVALGSLTTAAADAQAKIGWLWLRVTRDVDVDELTSVLSGHFSETDFPAVTLLRVAAVPHSTAAAVAVSAVGVKRQ